MLYSILKNWTTKIQNATNKMKNNRNHFLRTKQTKSLNIAYTKGSQLQDQIQRCSSNFMARRKPNPKSLKGHLPFPLWCKRKEKEATQQKTFEQTGICTSPFTPSQKSTKDLHCFHWPQRHTYHVLSRKSWWIYAKYPYEVPSHLFKP